MDSCRSYRRYLKTRIAPAGEPEPDPFGLDLATLHLDVLARERGYHGPWPGHGIARLSARVPVG